ncbi:DUF397 domain-containing protein [Streptomyces gardneri]|uniref:DUF397 domain-containing protein n=1 Tax=Streptomyces gardneri TaxID=66892 RepID=UPI0035D5ECB5
MNTTETSVAASELVWVKSSYSGAEGGECVEVAAAPGTIHIRDSKRLGGPVVTVTPDVWAGFVGLAARRSI